MQIPWSQFNDKLIDDDDMARQRKQIIYAQGNALVRKLYICVQKLSEFPYSNRIAPPCTQVRYGAITATNLYETYVLHTTMFLEKLPFCLETAVPVSCMPREFAHM